MEIIRALEEKYSLKAKQAEKQELTVLLEEARQLRDQYEANLNAKKPESEQIGEE